MCSLCQSTLKEKEHRKLHSDSTEHVLPILLEFPRVHFSHQRRKPSIFQISEAFLCRPCVRSIETLQKLRADPRDKDFLQSSIISLVKRHARDTLCNLIGFTNIPATLKNLENVTRRTPPPPKIVWPTKLCGHRVQSSREVDVWGHAPPPPLPEF